VLSSPALLRGFGYWDASHFLQIAATGYDRLQFPFFPLYPLLLHVLSLGRPRLLVAAGLVLSFVLAGAAIVLLARLVAIDDPTLARPACVLLLLFPGALFLSLPYSESLALLTLVGATYAARRRRWWLAGILGALAAAARATDLAIVVLLAVEHIGARERRWRDLPAVLLPLAGTAAFSLYLWVTVGDPLAFVHAQAGWERSVGDVGRALTHASATSPSLLVWLLGFALALLSIQFVRASYGLFASVLLIANPLTGTFTSSARYILLAWPIFVLGARWLRGERALLPVAVVLAFGLAFFGLLFVHGYWVA
jgi:hypothetical protein